MASTGGSLESSLAKTSRQRIGKSIRSGSGRTSAGCRGSALARSADEVSWPTSLSIRAFEVGPQGRIAQLTSLGFDASVLEIFVELLSGVGQAFVSGAPGAWSVGQSWPTKSGHAKGRTSGATAAVATGVFWLRRILPVPGGRSA